MMKVRFLHDFDYTPTRMPRMTVAYKAGWRGLVKRECGEKAVAAGKAVETKARKADGEAAEPE